jgi:octaprenyl-diphosphate synthase
VKEKGGIEYAEEKMMLYYQEALHVLKNSLPESSYRKSLQDLIQFTIERTK